MEKVKFKKGDKVKLLCRGTIEGWDIDWPQEAGLKVGKVYTVYKYQRGENDNFNSCLIVLLEEDCGCYAFDARYFKLAEKRVRPKFKFWKSFKITCSTADNQCIEIWPFDDGDLGINTNSPFGTNVVLDLERLRKLKKIIEQQIKVSEIKNGEAVTPGVA